MKRFISLRCVLPLLLLLLTFGGGPRAVHAQAGTAITYELSMPRPVTHLYEVTMTISGYPESAFDVAFPVWEPGDYRVVNPARNVQEVHATSAAGQTVRVTKTNPQTWRVEAPGKGAVRFSYKVFATQLSMTGIDLDDTHGFFNGAQLFPYVVGAKERPVTLVINKPAQWASISTSMDAVPGKTNTFTAPDYDTFLDCPVEIGNQQILHFSIASVPYEIAIYGAHNYDPNRFQSEVERIAHAEVDTMGGAPYKRYTFIFQMTPNGGGGLEHLSSTTIGLRKYGGSTEDGWDRNRGLIAHEFFHLWNVKRIRPNVLGPFDYTQPAPTRYLYVSEGMTSYYGDLSVRRSGLWTNDRYYRQIATTIGTLQGRPGRKILPVEETSLNTWFTPDDDSNVSYSYYTKGELLGMLLDLTIRHRTNNAKTLDDVFHYLLANYGLPKPGFPPGGFEKAVETVAGSSFADFFTKYASGTEELPYDEVLGYAGLRLQRKEDRTPSLGVNFGAVATGRGGGAGAAGAAAPAADTAGLTVSNVNPEGPAYGILSARDIVLAIGGERITTQNLSAQLARYQAGQPVPLTLFRGDRLLNVSVPLGSNPGATYTVAEADNATPEQITLRNSWLSGKK